MLPRRRSRARSCCCGTIGRSFAGSSSTARTTSSRARTAGCCRGDRGGRRALITDPPPVAIRDLLDEALRLCPVLAQAEVENDLGRPAPGQHRHAALHRARPRLSQPDRRRRPQASRPAALTGDGRARGRPGAGPPSPTRPVALPPRPRTRRGRRHVSLVNHESWLRTASTSHLGRGRQAQCDAPLAQPADDAPPTRDGFPGSLPGRAGRVRIPTDSGGKRGPGP